MSVESFEMDKNSDIIVSLTSFPDRIDLVYLAVRSILNQTLKPQKVVLWLGEDEFPLKKKGLPNSLLQLLPLGLDIEFCKDIGAHTKYYYAFKKYSDKLIVTVDDDIIYPKKMLATLKDAHLRYPDSVIANRVRYIEIENKIIMPYRKWAINDVEHKEPSLKLFATGVGGVLYKPCFFKEAFFDIDGIEKTNCIGDDIWLKAGQISSGIPVLFTNYYYRQFIEIPKSQNKTLFSRNVFANENDRQLKVVFEYFGINEDLIE